MWIVFFWRVMIGHSKGRLTPGYHTFQNALRLPPLNLGIQRRHFAVPAGLRVAFSRMSRVGNGRISTPMAQTSPKDFRFLWLQVGPMVTQSRSTCNFGSGLFAPQAWGCHARKR